MSLIKGKYRSSVKYLFLALFLVTVSMSAQNKELTEEEKIFKQIEEGIANGNVDKFSTYFSDKIFISLSTGTPKNYSSNQAYYVVKNFLGIHNPTAFKFDFSSSDKFNPFASGELKYIKNGLRGKSKVFIMLKNDKNQWKISQITIN
ncbi:MAG: hypothetical protein C0412_14235 [Flavobacterium sp.]|nr:hypothetical protein [Flavobacterium sp.]